MTAPEHLAIAHDPRVPQGKIRVTVEDLETGETECMYIEDDVCIVSAGSAYISSRTWYGNGTLQYTVKGVRQGPYPEPAS